MYLADGLTIPICSHPVGEPLCGLPQLTYRPGDR
jgi:hypothetical protein